LKATCTDTVYVKMSHPFFCLKMHISNGFTSGRFMQAAYLSI